jgi:hypothetical protein
MLTAIKLLHTAVWAILATAIVCLPVLGVLQRFRWAARVSGLIALECLVLAVNGGRCPLTNVAARFTTDRAPNFDICLPIWLAHHNKLIFGGLFIVGEFIVIICWLRHSLASCRAERFSAEMQRDAQGRLWPTRL